MKSFIDRDMPKTIADKIREKLREAEMRIEKREAANAARLEKERLEQARLRRFERDQERKERIAKEQALALRLEKQKERRRAEKERERARRRVLDRCKSSAYKGNTFLPLDAAVRSHVRHFTSQGFVVETQTVIDDEAKRLDEEICQITKVLTKDFFLKLTQYEREVAKKMDMIEVHRLPEDEYENEDIDYRCNRILEDIALIQAKAAKLNDIDHEIKKMRTPSFVYETNFEENWIRTTIF